MPETQAPPPLPKSQPSFTPRNTTIIKLNRAGELAVTFNVYSPPAYPAGTKG
jgi:hypothetical protein